MTWKGIDGRGMTVAELKVHVDALSFSSWRPSFMVLHNTGAPKLSQWHSTPGAQRMKNLERYYRDEQHWSAGPHAFIADDLIWLFTPFNTPGVHSPSWNGTSLGIEMVGDYAVEDDDFGPGFRVKMNAVALFATLHAKLGLNPETIRLHKEDRRTTHDCPGKDVDKAEFIRLVQEYMGDAGEHPDAIPIAEAAPAAKPAARLGSVKLPVDDTLNLRAGSSAAQAIVAKLKPGTSVEILGEAMNGATKWLRVAVPTLGASGWVAARFIVP